MEERKERMELDIFGLLGALLEKAWLIIVVTVIAGAAFFYHAAYRITPMYQASVLFYVNSSTFSVGSSRVSVSAGELSNATRLIQTYSVIIKTRSMLNEVISRGNLPYSTGQLAGMISAGSVNNTEVFSITVTNNDPVQAASIANLVAEVLPDKIAEIIEGSSVRIVDYAVIPGGKMSPNVTQYTMRGILMGFLASCALVAVYYIFFDYKIHSEDYLIQNYDSVPLLAIVPDITDTKGDNYYHHTTKTGSRPAKEKPVKEKPPKETAPKPEAAQPTPKKERQKK